MMELWPWLAFHVLVVALLVFDLGILHRREHVIGMGEAIKLSLFYIGVAGLFAVGVFMVQGRAAGLEWVTAYLVEKTLSIDNIFVFTVIFALVAIPPGLQHRVLYWGILGALAMRAFFIWAGVTLLEQFHFMVFAFGALLILTGIKMLWAIRQPEGATAERILAFARRHLPIAEEGVGKAFLVRRDGAWKATPLLLALLMVEGADVVFAVDSIPAVLAISADPFIVYTANVFAVLGLRALYFALASLVGQFRYLKHALSLVLVMIGAKMIANGYFGEKVIPVEWALLATVAIVGAAVVASLRKPPEPEPAE